MAGRTKGPVRPIEFGEPMKCDRIFKCFDCKQQVEIGEFILWDFNNQHRYHQSCGEAAIKVQAETPLLVAFAPDVIDSFALMLKSMFPQPTKPVLFNKSASNGGMTSDQTRAFNALAQRVDQLETQIKEMRGEA